MSSPATSIVDVLALSAPPDAAAAERCALWLREAGITVRVANCADVPDSAAVSGVLAVVAKATEELVMNCPAVGAAVRDRKLVMIVQLEETSTPPAHDFTAVPSFRMDAKATREALLRALEERDIVGLLRGAQWTGVNEYRRPPRSSLWQWEALALVVFAFVTTFWLWPSKVAPTPEQQPTAIAQQSNVLTHQGATQLAPTVPAAPTPSLPRPPAQTERAHSDIAMDHVRGLISSWNRKNGLEAGQKERVLAFYTANVWIEGMGVQNANGLGSTLIRMGAKWPFWHETVQTISAKLKADGSVVVRAISHYNNRNDAEQASGDGTEEWLYRVVFDQDDKPLVSRMEKPSVGF